MRLWEIYFMKNKKTVVRRQSRFTLVELLVAMGVLLVILGFILQFFISSQKVWTSMAQRNRIYADARVGMDTITTMLQNTFNTSDAIPFKIDRTTSGNHKIYFGTRSSQNLPGGTLKYVSFQRGTNDDKNTLKISVFCDEDSEFSYYFPPFGAVASIMDTDDARGELVTKKLDPPITSPSSANRKYASTLVKGVVAFDIIAYEEKTDSASDKDNGIVFVSGTSDINKKPFLVELRMQVLSPNDFKIWNSLSAGSAKDDFAKERSYTFSRTVFLGK